MMLGKLPIKRFHYLGSGGDTSMMRAVHEGNPLRDKHVQPGSGDRVLRVLPGCGGSRHKRTDTHPNAVAKLEERHRRSRETHASVIAELEADPLLLERGRAVRVNARAQRGSGSPLAEGIMKNEGNTPAIGDGPAADYGSLDGRYSC